MNANDVDKVARQIARGVYELLMANWDSIAHSGRTDPKQNGVATARITAQISTINSGSHVVGIVIPFRSVKDSTRLTVSDAGLEFEDDEGNKPDPSDPDSLEG